MEYIAYVVIGFFIAALGTLIGAGGGIIFVPLFLYLFPSWEPTTVIGTSLTIVMFNAISGTQAYVRQKKVYYSAAILFSIATFPGAIIGAIWSNHFNGSTFRLSFGLLLLFLSMVIAYKNITKKEERSVETLQVGEFSYNRVLGVAISIVVGFISSIFGIGGGVIHVPALIYLLGFPTHIATATSHFILSISTIVGVTVHYMEGHINLIVAGCCSLGAVFGAQAGARISRRTKPKAILIILSGALALLAIRLIYSSHILF